MEEAYEGDNRVNKSMMVCRRIFLGTRIIFCDSLLGVHLLRLLRENLHLEPEAPGTTHRMILSSLVFNFNICLSTYLPVLGLCRHKGSSIFTVACGI